MPEKKNDFLMRDMARAPEEPIKPGFEASNDALNLSEKKDNDEENPLQDLKAEVLSIDWEITDKVMTRFINEVNKLKDIFENDRSLLLFLKLLYSIGKYVKINKGKAHPNSIKLLNSVYNSLEKVVQLKGTTEDERNKILSIEVERFKKLKSQIALKKAEASTNNVSKPKIRAKPLGEEKEITVQKKTQAAEFIQGESVPCDDISQIVVKALEEMKEIIRNEFKALRTELKLWKETTQSGLKNP